MGLVVSVFGGGGGGGGGDEREREREREGRTPPAFAPRVRIGERRADRTFSGAAEALEHLDAAVAALAALHRVDPHRALAAVRADPRLLVEPGAIDLPCVVGKKQAPVEGDCVICRDAIVGDDGLPVGSCGHRCHADCVAHMVRSYAGQGLALPYPCPHLRCPGVVERSAMDAVEGGVAAVPRSIPRAYAACPTPDCAAYVLPADPDDLLPGGAVRCGACGADFCHACRSHAHPAVPCASLRSVMDALMVPIGDLALRYAVKAVYDGKLPPKWAVEEIAMVGLEPAAWVAPDPRGADAVAEARALLSASLDDDVTEFPELADLAGGAALEAVPRFCPKCFVSIVRVHGCVSMVCSACRHAFCYDCLGPVHGHSLTCDRNPDVRDLVRRATRAGVPNATAMSLLKATDLVTMDWGALDSMRDDRIDYERSLALARMDRGARLAAIRLTADAAEGGSDEAFDALWRLLAKERAWRARAFTDRISKAMRNVLARVTRCEVVKSLVNSARARLHARFNELLGRKPDDALVSYLPRPLLRPRMNVPVYGDVVNVDTGLGWRCFGDGGPTRNDALEDVLYVPSDEETRRAERLTSAMLRAFFVLAGMPGGFPNDERKSTKGLAAVFYAFHNHAHAFAILKKPHNNFNFGVLAAPGRETEARDVELHEAYLTSRMEDDLGRLRARVWAPPPPPRAEAGAKPSFVPSDAAVAALRAIDGIAFPSHADFCRACVARWRYDGDPPGAWYLEELAICEHGYFLMDSPSLLLAPPSTDAEAEAEAEADAWIRCPSLTIGADVDVGAPPRGSVVFLTVGAKVAELRQQRARREAAMEAETRYGTDCTIRSREANLRALLHARGFVQRVREDLLDGIERLVKRREFSKRAHELRERAHVSALERVLSRALAPDEAAWLYPAPVMAKRVILNVGATVTLTDYIKPADREEARIGSLSSSDTGRVLALSDGGDVLVRALSRGVERTWWYKPTLLVVVRGVDDATRARNVDVLRRGWLAMQAVVLDGIARAPTLAPLVRQLHSELCALGDVGSHAQANEDAERASIVFAFADNDYVSYLIERIEAVIS